MLFRLFLVSVSVAAFACVATVCSTAATVGAKGNDLAIYPSSGGTDTQLDVSSERFAPNVEVTFEIAFVSRIDEQPTAYSGPLAVQHTNGSGRNEVQVYLRDAPGITIPTEPSYVLFRATSAGPDPRVAQGIFVLTVDGRRPRGSGEVRLRVRAADGTTPSAAIFWWRRAGSDDEFYTPYAGSFTLPLQVTIPWLGDGEWEVLALGGSGTVAVGDGRIDIVNAGYCFLNLPPCGAARGPLRVKRVTIQDAQPVDVTIQLGAVQADTPQPVVTVVPTSASKDAMQVSGIVPVNAGTTITAEALDPVTIRGVTCATTTSVPSNDAPAGSSRFAVTIDRSCVERASGNMRICWGANQCQAIEFLPGALVDLGQVVLKTPVQHPPDTGFGPGDEHATSSGSNRIGYALGATAVVVAALGFMVGVAAILERRRKPI